MRRAATVASSSIYICTNPKRPPKKLCDDLSFFSACTMYSFAFFSWGVSGVGGAFLGGSLLETGIGSGGAAAGLVAGSVGDLDFGGVLPAGGEGAGRAGGDREEERDFSAAEAPSSMGLEGDCDSLLSGSGCCSCCSGGGSCCSCCGGLALSGALSAIFSRVEGGTAVPCERSLLSAVSQSVCRLDSWRQRTDSEHSTISSSSAECQSRE